MDTQTECQAQIYYSNGKFLVWDKTTVEYLRRHRILIRTESFPSVLSHNSAELISSENLGSFKVLSGNLPGQDDFKKHEEYCKELHVAENSLYVESRREELRKRNLENSETLARIGTLPFDKLLLPIERVPLSANKDYPDVKNLSKPELGKLVNLDKTSYIVYRDLWRLGFYLSSGTNFGADFLAYKGDPVLYHSKYSVRCVKNLEETIHNSIQNCDINAFQRLCLSARKIPLIAHVVRNGGDFVVKYYRLRVKEVITQIEQFIPELQLH